MLVISTAVACIHLTEQFTLNQSHRKLDDQAAAQLQLCSFGQSGW